VQTVISSEEEFGDKTMAAQAKGPRFNPVTASFSSNLLLFHFPPLWVPFSCQTVGGISEARWSCGCPLPTRPSAIHWQSCSHWWLCVRAVHKWHYHSIWSVPEAARTQYNCIGWKRQKRCLFDHQNCSGLGRYSCRSCSLFALLSPVLSCSRYMGRLRVPELHPIHLHNLQRCPTHSAIQRGVLCVAGNNFNSIIRFFVTRKQLHLHWTTAIT